MTSDHLSRRVMLAATAALPLLAAACRGITALGHPPTLAADVKVLGSAIAGERTLIAAYEHALRQQPQGKPAVLLSHLLAEHRAHLARLRELLVPAAPGAAAPRTHAAPVHLPRGTGRVLSYLASAEVEAQHRLLLELTAVPPAVAQLMASIAASEATHVPVLRAAGRHPSGTGTS